MARKKKRTQIVSRPECRNCPALCCKGFVMPITKPRTRNEIEELKFHIQYETVSAFIRSYRWYLLIDARCMYLTRDNLCRIYERRPQECRRHNPPDCERFAPFYDVMIRTPEELEEYLDRQAARSRKSRRRRRP